MGLHVGVCPEKEKNDKKEIILGYLMKHVKVSIFLVVITIFNTYRIGVLLDLHHSV